MKIKKLILVLYILAIITALVDLVYLTYSIYHLISITTSRIFFSPSFWIISLVVIILNALLLIYIGVFLFIRKKK